MRRAQHFFQKLKNLSKNEKRLNLPRPPAGLGWRVVFITRFISQKKCAKPVGGRGISAFSVDFFFTPEFLPTDWLALHRIPHPGRRHANILVIYTANIKVSVMRPSNVFEAWTIQTWLSFLRDEAALLRSPGARHKMLVDEANALHRANLIDRDELSDLLEQADGALAYAVETLLDEPGER